MRRRVAPLADHRADDDRLRQPEQAAGTAAAHGAPLGADEVAATKRTLGWPEDSSFLVPGEVREAFASATERGEAWQREWDERFAAYEAEHPEQAGLWRTLMSGELPEGWGEPIPSFDPADGSLATRVASGRTLNAIAERLPTLLGGSADLGPSNNTVLGRPEATSGRTTGAGPNLHFGVREHAMGGIVKRPRAARRAAAVRRHVPDLL